MATKSAADDTNGALGTPSARVLDLAALKALAHPLRAQILDQLSTFGPATASGLGERLGKSSGATSYHLRQLAQHGLVQEVEGRGTARERWWERVPGAITIDGAGANVTDAGRTAARIVAREWNRNREQLFADYMDRGEQVFPEEWTRVVAVSTTNVSLTLEQFSEIVTSVSAILYDAAERYRGQQVPDSRAVQLQFNAFPVIGPDTSGRRQIATPSTKEES